MPLWFRVRFHNLLEFLLCIGAIFLLICVVSFVVLLVDPLQIQRQEGMGILYALLFALLLKGFFILAAGCGIVALIFPSRVRLFPSRRRVFVLAGGVGIVFLVFTLWQLFFSELKDRVAQSLKKQELCDTRLCRTRVAVEKNDPWQCPRIEEFYDFQCIVQLAVKNKDPELCSRFEPPQGVSRCQKAVRDHLPFR